MQIHQIFTGNSLRNFNYLIEFKSKNFFCIDPWEASSLLNFIEERSGKLVGIINTHEHDDHTRGNKELKDKTNCRVYAHKNGKGKITEATDFLTKGDSIPLEDEWEFEIMDTPGHTFAHLCVLLKQNNKPHSVFSGDTLFNAGVGNCHNGGDPEILYKTISEQFQNLPGDVKVFPGHEYLENNLQFTLDREPDNDFAKDFLNQQKSINWYKEPIQTNIETEKKINTFMRLGEDTIIKKLEGADGPKQVFLKLRELRNNW